MIVIYSSHCGVGLSSAYSLSHLDKWHRLLNTESNECVWIVPGTAGE